MAASGAGDMSLRDRMAAGAANGVGIDGLVTSAGWVPLAAEPEPQCVERLIHRAPRRALLLEPLQQRRRALGASSRRRAPVGRRPHPNVYHSVVARDTDEKQRLRGAGTGAEQHRQLARLPPLTFARRGTRRHVTARSTTIAANSSAR